MDILYSKDKWHKDHPDIKPVKHIDDNGLFLCEENSFGKIISRKGVPTCKKCINLYKRKKMEESVEEEYRHLFIEIKYFMNDVPILTYKNRINAIMKELREMVPKIKNPLFKDIKLED